MNNANGSEKWRPITITNASNRMRTGRSMPEWMTKSGKGGPVPPPPPSPGHERNGGHRFTRNTPTPPDPEYEVIECTTSATQYMNSAPPPLPAKNPENVGRRGDGRHCDLCGSTAPGVRCEQCAQQIFCMSCDEMYHRHPKRQTHVRKPADTMFRPPLPPKGESIAAPVPPPRRNKRPGSALSRHGPPSPLPLRKEQMVPQPSSSAILDRMGSLKRMISNTHRPLPDTPNERPQGTRQPPEPPRPTPGATLDSRLSSLQERYRQHQEAMRNLAPTDRNRRDSNVSRPNEAPLAPRENFNDWESTQAPRMRAGSVSGLQHSNSIRSNASPPLSQVGDSRAGSVRGMSASSFDLNRAGMMSPGFNPNAGMQPGFQNLMQQAQSLAQLNCMNCQHGMWPGQQPQLTGSNLSLNMPPHGYHPHEYPPPVWMGPWGQPMYPGYPMGMMPGIMNNGTLPRRRSSSRPVSPTLSLKSRKSHVSRTSRRQGRAPVGPVMADDEESDEEDDRTSFRGARHRRESLSSRRRNRLNSATQSSLDDDIDDEVVERESIRARNKKHEEDLRQPRRKSSTVSDRTHDSRNQRRDNVVAPRKVASSASDNESLNQPVEDDGTPMGPPPAPPGQEWECEHCTFLNAAGVAICGVCCKTPSGHAIVKKNSVTEDVSENFSRQMKITSAGEDSSDGRKKGENKEEPTITETKPQNVLDSTLNIKDNSSVKSDKQESKTTISSGCGPSPPREIVPEVTKTEIKISTGCGPSSPREIVPEVPKIELKTETKPELKPETKSETKSLPETKSEIKHTTSTGTSPPPQSISTQTYDELPAHIASREKEEEEQRASTRTPRALRRSHSMHFSRRSSQVASPALQRSLSRQSFSSDTQSLPNTPPRELSPNRYDDEILAIAEQALASRYRDHPPRNYRSILDLRRPELYQPRRPSYADSRWADGHQPRSERGGRRSRAEPQPPDSILEDLINKRRADVMKSQGMELVRMLREAEQNKYTAEELQAALAHCSDGSDPVAWLKENWTSMIDTVRTLATNYGHERRENTVGTLSAGEARDALRQHRGNVWAAVTECVEQRQRKFAEIMSRGNFTREDIITSLTAHHGDSEAALMELNKSQLKPFLMRIWGPPAGMENDSANDVVDNNNLGNNIPSTSDGALAKLAGAMSLEGGPGRAQSEARNIADRIALKDFVSDNADKQSLASEAAIASTHAVSNPPQTNSSQENSMPPGESQNSTFLNHKEPAPKSQTSSGPNILDDLQAALIAIEANQRNTNIKMQDDMLSTDIKSISSDANTFNTAEVIRNTEKLPSTVKLDRAVEIEAARNMYNSSSESSSEYYEEPLVENKEITYGISKVCTDDVNDNGSKPVDLLENEVVSDHNEIPQINEIYTTNDKVSPVTNVSTMPKENIMETHIPSHQPMFSEVKEDVQTVLVANALINQQNNSKAENATNIEITSPDQGVVVTNKSKSKRKNKKKVKQKPEKPQQSPHFDGSEAAQILTEQLSNIRTEVNELQLDKSSQQHKENEQVLGTPNETLKVSNNMANGNELMQSTSTPLNHIALSESVGANKSVFVDGSNISETISLVQDNIDTKPQIIENSQSIPVSTSANSSKKQVKPKSRIPVKRSMSNPKTVKTNESSVSTDVDLKNASVASEKEESATQQAVVPQLLIVESQPQTLQLQLKENEQHALGSIKGNQSHGSQMAVAANNPQITEFTEKILPPPIIQLPNTENQQDNIHTNQSLPIVGTEQSETLTIVQPEEHQNLEEPQNTVVKKSGSGMKIIEVIVSNNSEDSEDELYSSTDSDYDEDVQEHLPKIESTGITTENSTSSAQLGAELSYRDIVVSPPNNKQQNLSKIVEDTQKIIKQMKDEINSDIASYVSEGEMNSEGSSYESSEYSGSEWSEQSDSEVFSSPEDIEKEGSYEDESEEQEENGEKEEGSEEESGSGTNVSNDDEDESYEEFAEAIENLENTVPQNPPAEINVVSNEGVIPDQLNIITESGSKGADDSMINSSPINDQEVLPNVPIVENPDSRIIPNNEPVLIPNFNNESILEQIIAHDIKDTAEIISQNEIGNDRNNMTNNVISYVQNTSVIENTDAEFVREKNMKNMQNTSNFSDSMIQNVNSNTAVSPDVSHNISNDFQNSAQEIENEMADVENVQTDEFILILNTNISVPDNEDTSMPENSVNEAQTETSKPVDKKESSSEPDAKISNVKRLQQGLMNKADTSNINKNITNVKTKNTNIPKRIDTKNTVSKFSPKSPTSPTKVELKPLYNSSKIPANTTKIEANLPKSVTTSTINSAKTETNATKSVANTAKAIANFSKAELSSAKPIANLVKSPSSNTKEIVLDTKQEAGRSKAPESKPNEKKKSFFRESCFSDEDISEDEPQPKPIKKTEDKTEIKDTLTQNDEEEQKKKTMLEIALNIIESEPSERQARRFLAEGLVRSYSEAELAVTLLDLKFDAESALYASRECGTLDAAIAFLQQECELCTGKYAMNQMVSMLRCVHRCCKECAANYFTIQITDRAITDCVCPFCKDPDLTASDEDDILDYFSHLDILLKGILHMDVHELFQRKLRDRTLMQDPNFKWCVKCSSGFFAHPRQKRLICPDCRSVTCAQCRRPWEKQHEGISCEQFAEWKEANDPDVQAEGVARHLRDHGIDCPKCKFRYDLSRGGCMHFTCSQCKYEFCCGCGKPFTMGAKCGVSPYCGKLGLHAHHPRNCLFYLRDKEPHELQRLLKINNVAYDVEPPAKETAKQENASPNNYGPYKCQVQLQKETPGGMIDSVCNADVLPGQAGLCRGHYVEYLVARVRGAGLDPLPAMDLTECVQELRRRGIALPERGPWDTDDIYRGMCQKIVLDHIPLD